MTDVEVLCEWMEPRPELPKVWNGIQASEGGWWILRMSAAGMQWFANRPMTLDALWVVEALLTEEQQGEYIELLRAGDEWQSLWHFVHAAPEQRLKALAAIGRKARLNANG